MSVKFTATNIKIACDICAYEEGTIPFDKVVSERVMARVKLCVVCTLTIGSNNPLLAIKYREVVTCEECKKTKGWKCMDCFAEWMQKRQAEGKT